MSLGSSLGLALALLATPLIAQSTSIDASQSTQISSALASYESSLMNGPVATSLAIAVAFDIPASELSSLASNVESFLPFPTTDQYSFATAPPVTGLSTPAWVTSLPSGVQSDLLSLRTSVVLAEASIVRNVLSITSTPSVVTASAAATSATGSSEATTISKSRICLSACAVLVAGSFIGLL
jgi:hypothetical protein